MMMPKVLGTWLVVVTIEVASATAVVGRNVRGMAAVGNSFSITFLYIHVSDLCDSISRRSRSHQRSGADEPFRFALSFVIDRPQTAFAPMVSTQQLNLGDAAFLSDQPTECELHYPFVSRSPSS